MSAPVSPADGPVPLARTEAEAGISAFFVWTVVFVALHIPLGLAMMRYPVIATAHAGITLLVALVLAFGARVERVVYTAAYFCGAEVLWRMSHARSPWEYAKYAVILVFAIGIARHRPLKLHWPSATFIVLLLPAVPLTMLGLDAAEARSQIAFNLAGPLALGVSVWFLSMVDLNARERRRLALALVAPLLSIASITAFGTYVVGGVHFGTESNFASSGGFGPNQVSGILGFGAVVSFLASFDHKAGFGFKLLMMFMTAILVIQSVMTFSRGGLMVALVAASASVLFLLGDRNSRVRLAVAGAALGVAAIYVVIPRLDSYTGGALSARFSNSDLTKRDAVVRDDIDIFLANPLLGVGPGMAKTKRARANVGAAPVAAHTEFSRLLAEHGIFGVGALAILVIICWQGIRRARTTHTRALATGFLMWGMMFMLQSGMRLVAPSLALGLAYAVSRGEPGIRRVQRRLPEWMRTAQLMLARAEDVRARASHDAGVAGSLERRA